MDIAGILSTLEKTSLATTIRESLLLFPMLESFHVIGLSMVFGTIAIIDLRLLGLASTQRPFTRIANDILKWTWAAFTLTVITGALMFTTNAGVYFHNFYFRSKMLLLLLAGINMLMFELTAGRSVERWDKNASAPLSGKTVAAISIVLWIGIIILGRWIGFTTSRAQFKAEPPDINLEDILPK